MSWVVGTYSHSLHFKHRVGHLLNCTQSIFPSLVSSHMIDRGVVIFVHMIVDHKSLGSVTRNSVR